MFTDDNNRITMIFIVAILFLWLIAVSGCSVNQDQRVKIAETLHNADAYAHAVQNSLVEDDPMMDDISKMRDEAKPVIDAVDAWVMDTSAADPSERVWGLLDRVDDMIDNNLEGSRLQTAKRVILGIRVSLLTLGLAPAEDGD